MAVLGFRGDTSCPRYAILGGDANHPVFLNGSGENRLKFPADQREESEKLTWLYMEFERILQNHTDVSLVVIKKGEFTAGDSNSKRFINYQDAILLLLCGTKGIQVYSKLYASLGAKSGTVQAIAERVGRSENYWDSKIADAIVAGLWGLKSK